MTAVETSVIVVDLPVAPELQGQLAKQKKPEPWSARGNLKVECVTPSWPANGKLYDGNK